MTHSSPPGPPVGVAAWPLVDGRIAWALAYGSHLISGHIEPTTGDHEDIEQLLAALIPALPDSFSFLRTKGRASSILATRLNQLNGTPDGVDPTLKSQAAHLAKQALAALPRTRLAINRSRRLAVPPGLSPYLVASDASVGPRYAAWSCVTGAGWYATGLVETSSVQLAEWIAAYQAIETFPVQARVTLLVDETSVAWYLGALSHNRRIKQIPWLSTKGLEFSLQAIRRRTVIVQHIPRNTHPLHALADQLCRRTFQSKTEPTVTSKRGRHTIQHLFES